MCTPSWQWLLAAACAVAGVPCAIIAAAKHTDAQAKAKELIIVFVSLVFIIVISFFLVL
jgi:predicted permease